MWRNPLDTLSGTGPPISLRRRVFEMSAPQQGYGQQAYNNQAFAGQPQPGVPVVGQPQWMDKPEGAAGCPPGLEYLTQVDQLLVQQKVELLEAFTGWETCNRFEIKNSMGQQVFYAAEESGICMRQCCKNNRGFIMHITDNAGMEVMRMEREFKCCAGGCCWCASCDCCRHVVEIQAPVGQTVGFVRQVCSGWRPRFDILDAEMHEVLAIEGPCCMCQAICCTGDLDFRVLTPDGSEVGKVSKQWSGLVKEMFTAADNFGVSFPKDLDVKVKAALLGAVFLVDFMYFENQGNNNNT